MKRSQQCAVVAGLILAVCGSALAQESDEVGSSITIVTAKEIEQQQKRTVADALRMVPGLDLMRSGTATYVFLRGSYVRISIDDVDIVDNSDADGAADVSNMSTDGIERIDILRGPGSSGAMAGVVKITTKRGSGKLSGFATAEGGSFYTSRETVGASGSTDLLHYSLVASRLDIGGTRYSICGVDEVVWAQKSSNQNGSILTNLGITPTRNTALDVTLRYIHSRTRNFDFDANRIDKTNDLQCRAQGILSLFDDLWGQRLGVSFANSRRGNDRDNSNTLDSARSDYASQSIKLDWQHVLRLKANTVSLGIEFKEDTGKSSYNFNSIWGAYSWNLNEHTLHSRAVYLQDEIKLSEVWTSNLAVRVDDHSQFGTEPTYRVSTAYFKKNINTTFKASFGTGYKAPTIYQLYAPEYGNSGLNAEKSIGWDVGFEHLMADNRVNIGATYFSISSDQLIDFQLDPVLGTSTYKNFGKAESRGVELTASFKLVEGVIFKAAYTYTATKDKTTGSELLHRPKNKASGDLNYDFSTGNLNIGLVYVGSNEDISFNFPMRATRKDYLLVNLAASYDLNRNLQVFGRIDNLLDQQYRDLTTGTPGIGAYGGVKVSF